MIIPIFSKGDLNRKRNRPGTLYWHGDISQKKVALTFDDGPNEPYTSEILNILKKYDVRATFFMIGKNIQIYPEAAKAVAEGGNIIGNHSYSHPNLIFDLDPKVRRQIKSAEGEIINKAGIKPYLFRPPYGGDDPLTLLQAKKLGYVVVKWSVSSKDWEKPGVEKIVKNVLNHVENGSIILMHDGDQMHHGGDRSQTVDALPVIITELRKQGYELVTVPELLGLNK